MNAIFKSITNLRSTDTITILPVEAHYSRRKIGNGFVRKLWLQLIQRLKTEKNTYVVFVGDMIDAHRPSLRDRLAREYAEADRKSAAVEADDDHRGGLESGIIADLRPVAHKILGAVDGDHFVLYQNNRTSTQHILDTLKIPEAYLGRRMGWVTLLLSKKGNSNAIAFKIFVRHGKGSTTTIGADMNQLVRQSVGFVADLYVAGHTHKKHVHSQPFLDCDRNGRIMERQIAWARAGSLLKGFIEGQTTYAEEAEYAPLHVGYPDVYLYMGLRNNNLIVKDIKGM